MYNYNLRNDYYNYENNNYNKPMYTEDANEKSVYDPYAGFIRGNMFKNLYNIYKVSSPVNLKAGSEKERMRVMLDAFDFALIDINLYLDVYPNDKDMINLFNEYKIQANKIKDEYESMYGPICLDSNQNMTYPWAWDNEPWPWENRGNQ